MSNFRKGSGVGVPQFCVWYAVFRLGLVRDWSLSFPEKFSNVLITIKFLFLGGLVGWLAWGSGSDIWRLSWIFVLPLAWGVARKRGEASALMAGYYLVACRGLPGVSFVFFGDTVSVAFGWLLWTFASVCLTLPFILLWSVSPKARIWRFLLAASFSAIPPLGLIGWVSPLAAAGAAFPNLRWVGLVLVLCLMASLVARSFRGISVFCLMAAMANVMVFLANIKVPLKWSGVDTQFSRLSTRDVDYAGELLASMRQQAWVEQFALGVPANSVVVLPETTLGTFTAVSSLTLQKTEAALAARGSRILVGAEVPLPNGQYQNALVVLGARADEDRLSVQNVPVPISMWKPWASDGAATSIFKRGNILKVQGVRAGVLVCYEQVLAYSLFLTMFEKPDVVVGVSNVWWGRGNSFPVIQVQSLNAFARLFGVPVVMARNL